MLRLQLIIPTLALILSACSPSEKGGFTVITINVKMAPEAEAEKCEALFADPESLIKRGTEGSSWIWFKRDNAPQHYCQKRSDGTFAVWAEVLESDVATHSLTFDSRREEAIFQPLPAKS
jgi:hypothetical protein